MPVAANAELQIEYIRALIERLRGKPSDVDAGALCSRIESNLDALTELLVEPPAIERAIERLREDPELMAIILDGNDDPVAAFLADPFGDGSIDPPAAVESAANYSDPMTALSERATEEADPPAPLDDGPALTPPASPQARPGADDAEPTVAVEPDPLTEPAQDDPAGDTPTESPGDAVERSRPYVEAMPHNRTPLTVERAQPWELPPLVSDRAAAAPMVPLTVDRLKAGGHAPTSGPRDPLAAVKATRSPKGDWTPERRAAIGEATRVRNLSAPRVACDPGCGRVVTTIQLASHRRACTEYQAHHDANVRDVAPLSGAIAPAPLPGSADVLAARQADDAKFADRARVKANENRDQRAGRRA